MNPSGGPFGVLLGRFRVLLTAWVLFFAWGAAADNTGVTAKIGTLGPGVELGHAFNDSFGIRLGVNKWNHSKDRTENGVDYDAKLKLSSFQLLADWYPFGGVFRVNAGLVSNGNKFTLTAKPSGSGTFTFNGVTYTSSQVGSVDGQVDFNKTAPYFGIGWGTSAGTGLTLSADMGVLFQGKPKSKLSLVCGSAVNCSQLTSDVNAEQAKLDDSLNNFRYYPVVSIGLGYRF
jgi:hypothetical protein